MALQIVDNGRARLIGRGAAVKFVRIDVIGGAQGRTVRRRVIIIRGGIFVIFEGGGGRGRDICEEGAVGIEYRGPERARPSVAPRHFLSNIIVGCSILLFQQNQNPILEHSTAMAHIVPGNHPVQHVELTIIFLLDIVLGTRRQHDACAVPVFVGMRKVGPRGRRICGGFALCVASALYPAMQCGRLDSCPRLSLRQDHVLDIIVLVHTIVARASVVIRFVDV
mmetsp:Transcript_17044/g.40870  ORF Transcript_17044/g.40870 Transcript_17044/m.40870 type:complete len:223 (-) Transcript_17044:1792-2460(-)